MSKMKIQIEKEHLRRILNDLYSCQASGGSGWKH